MTSWLPEGFRRIGTLDCDLHVELWWHAEHRLEVSVVAVEEWALIRGAKYYRLKAMGEQGELYTRDLAAFDADLTTRFGEVHLLLSAFPDITADLARRRIAEKRFRQVETGSEVSRGQSYAKPEGGVLDDSVLGPGWETQDDPPRQDEQAAGGTHQRLRRGSGGGP